MAKQKKEDIPAVRYDNGRWITADGLSFNTQSKAEAHIFKNQVNQIEKAE